MIASYNGHWTGTTGTTTHWLTTETETYGTYDPYITLPLSTLDVSSNSVAYSGYRPEPEPLSEREEILLRHRASSRLAVCQGRMALRGALDDPTTRVPIMARKLPYVRPTFKKRVCAGSSRYRVLVN